MQGRGTNCHILSESATECNKLVHKGGRATSLLFIFPAEEECPKSYPNPGVAWGLMTRLPKRQKT